MYIDRDAPLQAKKDIPIAFPLEKVWSEITRIDQGSGWQSGVTSSKLDGALTIGTSFIGKQKD